MGIQAGPKGMLVLIYRYIEWVLILKLFIKAFLKLFMAPLDSRYTQVGFNLICV